MPLLTLFLLNIGFALAKQMVFGWVGDDAWKGLADGVLDFAKDQFKESLSGAEQKQVETIALQVVEDMRPIFEEARQIDSGEKEAIVLAAGTALGQARLDTERLIELGLDAHGLAVYFGKANPQAERDLSPDGRALYRRLLEESSRAILMEWARLAKDFDWKINETYLQQHTELARRLDDLYRLLEASSRTERPKPPLQLLPRAAHFVGREEELAKLLADLKPGAVVEVCGPGGMGKTALAAEAICNLTEDGTEAPKDFSDGVVVHSFYKQADVNLAFDHIVRSYGGEAKPTPAIAAQELLARKQALLVLDGAEQADNLEALLAVRRADHQQEERGEGDPAGFTAAGGSRSGGAAERLGRGMGCG